MSDKVLILRSTGPDRKSHGGFQWPESGYVEAPDWDPDPSVSCGNGLHGLLWGQGAIGLTSPGATDRVWQVVEVDPADIADVNAPDKVRFRCGTVLLSTADRVKAASLVAASAPAGIVVPFGSATAGDRGTATAGYYGTATAGDGGTATAGYRGTATAGDGGTATAGCRGSATAGYYGSATAGDGGTATAGDYGSATAGDYGTATAGYRGSATAGYRGTVYIKWWDGDRYRLVVGYVGEDGIEPNTPYRVVVGKLVAADEAVTA